MIYYLSLAKILFEPLTVVVLITHILVVFIVGNDSNVFMFGVLCFGRVC